MSTTTRRASRGRTGRAPAVTATPAIPAKPVPNWPLSDTPLYSLRFDKLRLPFALTAGMYALVVDGDCCAPEIGDGATVVIDPATWPAPGDFVVLHFNTGAPPAIKRLVDEVRPSFFKVRPEEGAELAFRVEMLNPPKRLLTRCFLVAAIHRVAHGLRKGAPELDAAAAAAAGRA